MTGAVRGGSDETVPDAPVRPRRDGWRCRRSHHAGHGRLRPVRPVPIRAAFAGPTQRGLQIRSGSGFSATASAGRPGARGNAVPCFLPVVYRGPGLEPRSRQARIRRVSALVDGPGYPCPAGRAVLQRTCCLLDPLPRRGAFFRKCFVSSTIPWRPPAVAACRHRQAVSEATRALFPVGCRPITICALWLHFPEPGAERARPVKDQLFTGREGGLARRQRSRFG